MVKTILYTSNPDFVPNSLEQVGLFAEKINKLYFCYANEDSEVGKLQIGAHVLTSKGNHVYVLNVRNDLHEYSNAKKCNITGIVEVDYPFESTICTEMNSTKDLLTRVKEMFTPTKASDVRIATDGSLCVATSQGYVAINKENQLIAYPEELTLPLPVFIISKPKEQLAVGDTVALEKSYAKVTKIDGDKITAISYSGSGKTIHTIKDFIFNQTMIRVAVNLAGGGQINPMMLLALSDKNDKKFLLPFLMMGNSNLGMNPMMLLALSDDKEIDVKDMLLISAISGNTNPFNGLFLQQAPEIVE